MSYSTAFLFCLGLFTLIYVFYKKECNSFIYKPLSTDFKLFVLKNVSLQPFE